jgi:hypothetical protein
VLETCRELEINKYIERNWYIKLVIYQEWDVNVKAVFKNNF